MDYRYVSVAITTGSLFRTFAFCVRRRLSTNKFHSLHPSITETFYALSAGTFIEGRSDYCNALKRTSTTKLQDFIDSNFEMLMIETSPILLGTMPLHNAKISLSQLGTVHSLPWLSVDDVRKPIITIGDMTDSADAISSCLQTLYLMD